MRKKGESLFWFENNAGATLLLSAMNGMLVSGEDFMMDAVVDSLEYSSKLGRTLDPSVHAKIQVFLKQEIAHRDAHEKQLQALSIPHAYSVFCRALDLNILRKLPLKIRLGISTAIEHCTAVFGVLALEKGWFRGAAPKQKALFEWHCREEVEHREAVFDLLGHANQNRPMRLPEKSLYMGLALLVLSFCLSVGVGMVFVKRFSECKNRKERFLLLAAPFGMIQFLFVRQKVLILGAIRGFSFFRFGFHPRKLF